MERVAPKKAKMSTRDIAEGKKEQLLGDLRLGANKKSSSSQSAMKPVRQRFAVGGIDQDMADWAENGSSGGGGARMSKKAIKEAAREKAFTDFDPEKRLRKGGKIGHNSFKSKSKFKRR